MEDPQDRNRRPGPQTTSTGNSSQTRSGTAEPGPGLGLGLGPGPEAEAEAEAEADPLGQFERGAEGAGGREEQPEPGPKEYFSLPLEQTLQISMLGAHSIAHRLVGIPEEKVEKAILPLEFPGLFLQAFNHDGQVPLFRGGRSWIETVSKRALINKIVLFGYQVANGLFCLVSRRRMGAPAKERTRERREFERCPQCQKESAVRTGKDAEKGLLYFRCTNATCRHEFEREIES